MIPVEELRSIMLKSVIKTVRNWKKASLRRTAQPKVASTSAASEETKSSATSVDSAVPSLSAQHQMGLILWTLPSTGKFSSEKNQVFICKLQIGILLKFY